jgi:hypothetical protein
VGGGADGWTHVPDNNNGNQLANLNKNICYNLTNCLYLALGITNDENSYVEIKLTPVGWRLRQGQARLSGRGKASWNPAEMEET